MSSAITVGTQRAPQHLSGESTTMQAETMPIFFCGKTLGEEARVVLRCLIFPFDTFV